MAKQEHLKAQIQRNFQVFIYMKLDTVRAGETDETEKQSIVAV
ncbi:MAG: hypothetical protein ACI9R3_000807 [Verrucomicrobiales bacterium]|jgi:hypothetical protein